MASFQGKTEQKKIKRQKCSYIFIPSVCFHSSINHINESILFAFFVSVVYFDRFFWRVRIFQLADFSKQYKNRLSIRAAATRSCGTVIFCLSLFFCLQFSILFSFRRNKKLSEKMKHQTICTK